MAEQILDAVGVHGWERLGIDRRHHRHRDVRRALLLPGARREAEARGVGRSAVPGLFETAVRCSGRPFCISAVVRCDRCDASPSWSPVPREWRCPRPRSRRSPDTPRSSGCIWSFRPERHRSCATSWDRSGPAPRIWWRRRVSRPPSAPRFRFTATANSTRRFLRGPTRSPERSSCPAVREPSARWPPGRRAHSSIGPVRWRSRSAGRWCIGFRETPLSIVHLENLRVARLRRGPRTAADAGVLPERRFRRGELGPVPRALRPAGAGPAGPGGKWGILALRWDPSFEPLGRRFQTGTRFVTTIRLIPSPPRS